MTQGRDREIPAAEQSWRLETSIQWLTTQFDVTPLAFTAGGGGISTSAVNNTVILAGRAGFGWLSFFNNPAYLSPDLMIADWCFFGTKESPTFLNLLPNGHDFGVSKAPQEFARIFTQYPDHTFIGINEFIGYLHAANSGYFDLENQDINLAIGYADFYYAHFRDHESVWIFEVADWVQNITGATLSIQIDNREPI